MAPPSDAQKRARDKWDKEHMKVLGCKVSKEVADAFKDYAAEHGETVNSILTDYVLGCLNKTTDM